MGLCAGQVLWGAGPGGALGAWGGCGAVPGLCRAWRGVGTALPHLPPWQGSDVSLALVPRLGDWSSVWQLIPAGWLLHFCPAPAAPDLPSGSALFSPQVLSSP